MSAVRHIIFVNPRAKLLDSHVFGFRIDILLQMRQEVLVVRIALRRRWKIYIFPAVLDERACLTCLWHIEANTVIACPAALVHSHLHVTRLCVLKSWRNGWRSGWRSG